MNGYGYRQSNPVQAFTQGFLSSYPQWRSMLMNEQYRQSLLDMRRTSQKREGERLDMSREYLELAKEKAKGDPYETYGQMLNLTNRGMPAELGVRGLAGAGHLTDFSPYSTEALFPQKGLSPSQQINEMMLGEFEKFTPEQLTDATERRFLGAPGQAKTTLQIEDLSELFDAEFDEWQMGMPGGFAETMNVWGQSEQTLSDTFSPDSFQIDSLIDEMTTTYGDITGIPKENLENLARMRARRRFKGYGEGKGKTIFQKTGGRRLFQEPTQEPIAEGDLDAALKQAKANLGKGANDEQIIKEAVKLLKQ